jgi:hypothetical protein
MAVTMCWRYQKSLLDYEVRHFLNYVEQFISDILLAFTSFLTICICHHYKYSNDIIVIAINPIPEV